MTCCCINKCMATIGIGFDTCSTKTLKLTTYTHEYLILAYTQVRTLCPYTCIPYVYYTMLSVQWIINNIIANVYSIVCVYMLLVFRLLLLPGYLFLQYKLVLLIRSKCCYFSMFCCCVFPCSLELKLSCPSRKQQRS